MRRLNKSHRDDSGVATIFVILAITAMLLGAALAIDVGGYVAAARSAQNSADATVLAVATDCALTGAPITDYALYRKTGQTINTPACGSGETTITVTKTVDGLLLAQSAGDVDRTAVARWGTLSEATTVPIAISDCEFSPLILAGGADITIYLDDTKPESGCSSLPGGFSQLRDDVCAVNVTAGATAQGQPGAALGKLVPCITNSVGDPFPHVILIPLYDSKTCKATGCKGNGQYPILGFAGFKVTGYSLNGNDYAGTLGKKCPDEARGKYCLRGDFVPDITSGGTPGPSTNYGVTQVYLYS